VQILNPTTNTVLSALATLAINLAIMSPLFWVPRLPVTTRVIRTVCLFMWMFHSLSSVFGVLQVYFPGQYQPAVSQAVKEQQYGGDQLKITIASGEYVYRPMGLTDMPGGAAMAGMYAFLFGIGLLSISRSMTAAVAGFLSLPIGMFCIYLSQVRSVLILVLMVTVAYALVLAATRRYGAAVRVAFIVPVVVAAGFIWALAMGGQDTLKRFESLIEENPAELYSKNRGLFLNETFDTLLPEYPFGAGLGRWGMMNAYFGDPTMPESFLIWVEIQWTAWVVDGGIILLAGNVILLGLAVLTTGRIAFRSQNVELSGWAKLILAYDLAMMALTFSYTPFAAQSGIEFWLMNTMIFAADTNDRRQRHERWREATLREAAWRAG
jgi:hypothetical protein